MLENLQAIDRAVFLFINGGLANPVTDFIMPIVTSDHTLRVLYGLAVALLLWKGNARLRWMVLFSAMVLLLTDQFTANLLKDWIGRLRPCRSLTEVHLLVGCGSGFSMPSAHSANSFAQAALFGFHFPRFRWYLYGLAAVIALSRVFVGVHYPFDILAGAAIGTGIGLALAGLFGPFEFRFIKANKS